MAKILIADDEDLIRMLVSKYLGRNGHEVQTASDGADALQKLGEFPADLIISDVKMPGMTVSELLEELPAAVQNKPIILLSGAPDLPDGLSAETVFETLYKPIELKDLLINVNRALDAANG